jgi:class 3 adenylate cyclase
MTQSALLEGRQAAERYAWGEALSLLSSAEAQPQLGPDDLMALADSAWWMGKMRDCIDARERAHRAYLAAGQTKRAGLAATRLADHHADLGEMGVAMAWFQTASKLFEPEGDCNELGYLHLLEAMMAMGGGNLDGVVQAASKMRRIGEAFADKDLVAFSLAAEGSALVHSGEIDRGIVLLEEATIPAVSGELGPYATGWIYCIVISTTSAIADWQRAGQWSEAAKRWCDRQAINGFPGVCRVHRAEIMRLRGALADAEEEARTATEELGGFNTWIASNAFRELGEIRLRTGDIDGAEAAFRQANELGALPQPGMALVLFMRGKVDAALNSLRRALADEAVGRLDRAKMLPAGVEIAIAAGDTEMAGRWSEELCDIAEAFSSSAMRASAAATTARVKAAVGDLPGAEIDAKRSRRLWKENDILFEAARVCVILGDIYLAEGDRDGAAFEYTTALSTFEKFGALPDADIARARLATVADAPELSGRRVAKTFLFSDIVRSTNLVEAIGDDAWTDLLKWHDETLRAQFRAHHGVEVAHTGDGFFIAFEDSDHAVSCAIDIQRALAQHRRTHGFAPQVRLGLHATEAAEVAGNFHGKGVHEAARIGALAEGGEILVSTSTLECVNAAVKLADQREVELKGVSGPVSIASLVWRED